MGRFSDINKVVEHKPGGGRMFLWQRNTFCVAMLHIASNSTIEE